MSSRSTRITRPFVAATTALLLAALAVTLVAGPASAHARLEASDPAGGATVEDAPLEVVLRFNEEVSNDFATVQVSTPSGERVDAENPVVNGVHVNTRLLPLTEAGEYGVAFRVVSADGHPVQGSFTFTLTEGAVAPQPADPPAPAPEPAEPPAEAPEDQAPEDRAPEDQAPGDEAPEEPTESADATEAPSAEATVAPTEVATELTPAPGRSGISPGLLVGAIAALVVLAGVGFALTRRSAAGADSPGRSSPGGASPGGASPGGASPSGPAPGSQGPASGPTA